MQIVPQYVDVEDKIAGPLTWKHIGWLFAGAACGFMAWSMLDKGAFIVAAIIIGIITAAMAFYRPNGVSMFEFVGYGITFLFHPKRYTWQREVEKMRVKKHTDLKIASTHDEKKLTSDDVAAIAQTLDSHGAARNQRIQELIREQARKNKA